MLSILINAHHTSGISINLFEAKTIKFVKCKYLFRDAKSIKMSGHLFLGNATATETEAGQVVTIKRPVELNTNLVFFFNNNNNSQSVFGNNF